MYLAGIARPGPSLRDNRAVTAMARLLLHPHIPNIQTSWVKLGTEGAVQMPVTPRGWTVVAPVKPFSWGTSRLAPDMAAHRAGLARCFYLDTVHAVLSTPAVSRLIVVTGDADAADHAFAVTSRAKDGPF